MNDKEKKAIKRCYRRINELKLNFAITNEDLNAIEIILNLIENQKAEIEKKDAALKECERNLIEERQNRIKEDKIINLMAEDIYGYQIECNRYFKDKEEVIKYFEKKAEEE